jgi:hypothetical protein
MGGAPNRLMPAKHGGYVRTQKGLALRDRGVQRIAAKIREECPWIKPQHMPLLRRYCELERRATRINAYLNLIGEINNEGEPRRLLDEHRKTALAQAQIASALGLTPASEAAIKAEGRFTAFDVTDAVAERVVEIGKGRAQAGQEAVDDGNHRRERERGTGPASA